MLLTKEIDMTRFETSLQLHFFHVVVVYCCNQRLLQVFLKGEIFSHYQGGHLIIFGVQKNQARQYPVDRC